MNKHGNIITGEIIGPLPTTKTTAAGTMVNAGKIEIWAPDGWREVTAEDSPPAGHRILTQGVVELTSLTCKLTVLTSANIAEEEAILADQSQSLRWAGKTPTHVLESQRYKSLL